LRSWFECYVNMLPHILLCRELSSGVLKEAVKTKSVSSGNLTTLGDFLAMMATWFYDLNYPATRQLAVRRDILGRIRRDLPDVRTVRGLFSDIDQTLPKSGWTVQCP